MPNTYSQIYLHFVFAVQNRISLINERWQDELFKYISTIIANNGHKTLSINGMPDHVHALISMNPKQAPSDLMYDVKRSSSLWINKQKLVPGKFSWQEGFGVFSYGKSQIPNVAQYIENQKEHHYKRNFIDEYKALLEIFGIEYDDRYIYKPIE
jgi:REP element-mobilizing transposase RayT